MNILFAGEGGQGVQAIAEILARAAFLDGKQSLYIPNFGVEQRGGVSLAFVVIDTNPVVYPKFAKADLLLILSNRSFERVSQYIGEKTEIIRGPGIKDGIKTTLPTKVWNILLLGRVNKLRKIVSKESLVEAINLRFKKQFGRDPKLRKMDMEALNQ